MTTDIEPSSRETAAPLAARAQLLDITLRSLHAELTAGTAEPPYEIHVEIDPSYDLEQGGEDFWLGIYMFRYGVKVTAAGAEAAELGCQFLAAYGFAGGEKPSEGQVLAFGESTVTLGLHPYVRELVQNVGGRLGLAGLLLPIYKEPLVVRPPATPAKKMAVKAEPSKPRSQTKKASPRKKS